MPPTKRWLLDKYLPMMQDCWAYCFSSKAKDRHVHRLLVSRLVTNTTAKCRLRVDIIDWLDFTFARSTRSINSTWVDSVDRLDSAENRSTRSIDSIDFKVYQLRVIRFLFRLLEVIFLNVHNGQLKRNVIFKNETKVVKCLSAFIPRFTRLCQHDRPLCLPI